MRSSKSSDRWFRKYKPVSVRLLCSLNDGFLFLTRKQEDSLTDQRARKLEVLVAR